MRAKQIVTSGAGCTLVLVLAKASLDPLRSVQFSSGYKPACALNRLVQRVVLVTHVLPGARSGTSMVGTPVPQVQVNMLASSLMRAI